ncbi:MAG: hypothetical protein EOO27_07845 [Comamonadaceae bacterium]|nr:MAG: hypothetical protein EOO27_07845 [Comamonadaceae bacterium]
MLAEQRDEIVRQEQERGRELHEQGILKQIWRLPEKRANIGLWSAESPEDRHTAAIVTIPVWPYATVEIASRSRSTTSRWGIANCSDSLTFTAPQLAPHTKDSP